MLREIVFTCVFALLAADNVSDASYFKRLSDDAVPVHYNIKLIPQIEEGNFTFDGESTIVVKILRKTRTLSLHKVDLIIDEAATTLINSNGNSYTPTNHMYDNVTSILTLSFDNELPPEIYHLNMKFVGVLAEDLHGFYRSSYTNEEGNKVWLAATQFKPTWARGAFPCWDEPALKATFNISIKHHRNYTALSNMPMRKQMDDGNENGMIWTHFETTPIMSTYLVAFVVSDFVRVPNEDGTINMWYRSDLAPHVKFAQEVAAKVGQLLTAYTNSSDKVPKMDHVAIPDFTFFAMEYWGLITYSEEYYSYNEETDSIVKKKYVADLVARNMVHQWFGNVVSPLWWSEVWLHEGFALFFANYFLDQMFQDLRKIDDFVVNVQRITLHYDIPDNKESITPGVNNTEEFPSLYESLSLYSLYTSNYRVLSILRMIQHSFGEDVFRNGIIKYLHAHQFGSATTDDFWRALQEALDESDVSHDDYKVKDVMNSWLKQKHYPVVRVTRNYENGDVILTQEHFRPRNDTEHINDKWWIPITFATKSNPDFSNTLPTHWLKPHDQNVTIKEIDPNDWIIVNLQQTGYYRVNYDLNNWLKIAQYLDSDDYEKIHVLNRAQIIDDAYRLMEAKQLNSSTFLSLAKYLQRETDYIAWEPMFTIFVEIDKFLKLPNSSKFKALMVDMLSKLVERIGYEENPGEDNITKFIRPRALQWACIYGHTECRRIAAIKLREYLADPETHKISPSLKEWTYCSGIMQANLSTWNKFSENYNKTANMSFESLEYYLTYSEDPDVIISFLNKSLSGDLMTNTHRNILYYASVDHADNDIILDYVLENINNTVLRGDIIDQTFAIKQLIDNIHSVDRLEKVSNFVKTNYNYEQFEYIKTIIDDRKGELSDLIANFPFNEELDISKN